MKKILQSKNQTGFAHPILLVVLLVTVVGLVGYSGQRIATQRSKEQAAASQSRKKPIIITSTAAQDDSVAVEKVSISGVGSAAKSPVAKTNQGVSPSQVPDTKVEVLNKFDVTSPVGSLSQLIYEVKRNNYSSALYFITPRLMTSAYSAVKANNISNFTSSCQSNSACTTLLSTDFEIDTSHVTEKTCDVPAGSSFVDCKEISVKFVIESNKIMTVYYKTVGFQVYEASAKLLRGQDSPNWVLDQVTVNGFTL